MEDLNGFLGYGTFSFKGYEPIEKLNKIKKIKIVPINLKKKFIKNNVKSKDRITLKNELLTLKININKDYAKIDFHEDRKMEFINDLQSMINEYFESNEIDEFIEYYD